MSAKHNFWRDKRAEAESNRDPSAYQPIALALRQSISHTIPGPIGTFGLRSAPHHRFPFLSLLASALNSITSQILVAAIVEIIVIMYLPDLLLLLLLVFLSDIMYLPDLLLLVFLSVFFSSSSSSFNFCLCGWLPRSGVLRTQKLRFSLLRTRADKLSPFKAWSSSEYIRACFTHCQVLLPCLNLDLSGPFIFILPP